MQQSHALADSHTMTGQWQRELDHAQRRWRVAIGCEVVAWPMACLVTYVYRDQTYRTTPAWAVIILVALLLAAVLLLPTISDLSNRIRSRQWLLRKYGKPAPVTHE
ncbi:hypothetical protein HY632_05130 [Candidatus Uhrbacteria bacterium]|nr:hypothetical protein [Candidatus Uhrbacteria bacterium]